MLSTTCALGSWKVRETTAQRLAGSPGKPSGHRDKGAGGLGGRAQCSPQEKATPPSRASQDPGWGRRAPAGRAEQSWGHQSTLQERHPEGEAAASPASRCGRPSPLAEGEAHRLRLPTPGARPTRPGRRSPPLAPPLPSLAQPVLQQGGSFLDTQGPQLVLPPLPRAWKFSQPGKLNLLSRPRSSPEIHVVTAEPF